MKTPPSAELDAASDGRVRRSVRSREAIVAALMELVGGGVLQPTVHQVASRAGVGVRSVFRHFSEMETLHRAMDARLEAQVTPMLAAPRPEGTIAVRVAELVRRRAAFFERVAPYKRSSNVVRWRSSFLQDRHLLLQRLLHVDLLAWFPELRTASPSVVEAVGLVSSFEAWDRLRSDRQLGLKASAAAMEVALLALLRDLDGKTPASRPRRRAARS